MYHVLESVLKMLNTVQMDVASKGEYINLPSPFFAVHFHHLSSILLHPRITSADTSVVARIRKYSAGLYK